MAATMVVLYTEPADRTKFESYYFEKHMPLVDKMPGLQKAEVNRFTGDNAPYYLMATLYFADTEARKAAINSPEGKAAINDVPNFAPSDTVTVMFADVL
jgi:uncharacterized protein (TIGR02118 family)